jgi:hypothetical protein
VSTSSFSASVRPPLRARRWFVPLVAIAVIAVVIIAVLATAAYLAPKSSPAAPDPYLTLNQAEAVAAHAVAQQLSGSWTAATAVALRISSNISFPSSLLPTRFVETVAGCNLTVQLTALPSLPENVPIGATPTPALAGAAAFWLLGLTNGDGGEALASVNLGVPSALYSVGVQTCVGSPVQVAPFPTSTPDSPALVAAANASGGSAFLAAHPYAAQIWGGVGGFTADGITLGLPFSWEVVDTSCPLPYPVNETGYEFNATLSPTGGVVATSNGSVSCDLGLGTSLPTLLAGAFGSQFAVTKAI